ncbi:MAG: DUF4861 domain-containing protein [Calditrichaceae bacterium]|nr:DUF4861 domain-containing protein [Calditrichaceae bacterium]
MNAKHGLTLIFIVIVFTACTQDPIVKEYPKAFDVTLDNSQGPDRVDEVITLDAADIKVKHSEFNPLAFVVLDGNKELASQVNDVDSDHEADQIVFVCDLKANQIKNITIRYSAEGTNLHEYPVRTQAEISHKVGGKFVNRVYEGGAFQNVEYLEVPPEHNDHSWFIRYEGPGWESDKVGYRFYLDWRNATDIFGKRTHEMVLQDVGLDGFDSYHEMSDWGMDILKVGDSFGIGTWGMWAAGKAHRVAETDQVVCTITVNGPVQSKIRTNYDGWNVSETKYNLVSTLTINAGSRLTRNELEINGTPENLCTGIVKLDSTEVIKSDSQDGKWQYFSTWGRQSLNNDNLGMAIFYKQSDLISLAEDNLNHLIILKPADGKVSYYFAAAWEKEPNGITTKKQFINYLDDTIQRLDVPIGIIRN